VEQTEQSVRRFVGEVAPGEAVLSVLGQADYIDTPEWASTPDLSWLVEDAIHNARPPSGPHSLRAAREPDWPRALQRTAP